MFILNLESIAHSSHMHNKMGVERCKEFWKVCINLANFANLFGTLANYFDITKYFESPDCKRSKFIHI
jgi:hypothetical protein